MYPNMLVKLCDNIPYLGFNTKFVPVYDVKNGELWCFMDILEFPVALSVGIIVFFFSQALREALSRANYDKVESSSYPMPPIAVVHSCFSTR